MAKALNTISKDRDKYIVKDTCTQGLISNVLSAAAMQEFPGCTISCDIHKTAAPFTNRLKGYIELDKGAHYYVHSTYSALSGQYFAYRKATATINLRDCAVTDPTNNRRAFISLGINSFGKITQCDAGLAYDTTIGHWYPMIYSQGLDDNRSIFSVTGDKVAGVKYDRASRPIQASGAYSFKATDTVRIDYLVGQETSGRDYIYVMFWVGANLVADVKISGNSGTIWGIDPDSGRRLMCFIRFMSLVPRDLTEFSGKFDDADNSTLKGRMSSLYLCTGDNDVKSAWGKNLISDAWAMQVENINSISLSDIRSGGTATVDSVFIKHNIQTH